MTYTYSHERVTNRDAELAPDLELEYIEDEAEFYASLLEMAELEDEELEGVIWWLYYLPLTGLPLQGGS